MKCLHTVLLPILAIFVFNSCTTSTGVVQQGSVIGRVYLGSSYLPPNESNNSISVTLSGNTSYSAVSADSGKYVFKNVIQGIYTVTYSKVGYISSSVKNVQFVGNGTLELSSVFLRQEPLQGKSTIGSVRLFDENGDSLSDHSGVMVTIVGTSNSAISDPTGTFYFPKYPAGKFDVSFSKSGYQTFVVPNVVFPDSNTITYTQGLVFQNHSIVALSQPPKFEVQFDSVRINRESNNSNHYFELLKRQDGSDDTLIRIYSQGRILPDGYGKRISLISVVGDTPDVNIDTYDPTISDQTYYTHLNNPERRFESPAGHFDFRTPNNRWHVLHAGKEVYFKIYAQWTTNDKFLHYFHNHNEKRIGMSGYSSSKVIKIIFPTTYRYN